MTRKDTGLRGHRARAIRARLGNGGLRDAAWSGAQSSGGNLSICAKLKPLGWRFERAVEQQSDG